MTVTMTKCLCYNKINDNNNDNDNLYIYFACLGVCLFVSNKHQYSRTDRAQIFCGASCDPREGL